jgi:hypothetical protein
MRVLVGPATGQMLFVVQQSTSAPGPAGCAVVNEFAEPVPAGGQLHRSAGVVSLRRGGSRALVSEVQERLLRLLDDHRVLTTAQLMEITAAPERTTEYRMAVLAKRGLVGRVRPPRGRGTHPWHWWLTPAGARLVTGTACAEDRGGPNPLFVRHAAATADMWLALTQAGPAAGLDGNYEDRGHW